MPVPKAVMTLAVPTIISQIVTMIYNLADTFFIGQFGDPCMVAAVSLVSPWFNLLTALGNLFGLGGGTLISRMLGRRDHKDIKYVTVFSIWGGALTTLIFCAGTYFARQPLLNFLGASTDTYGYAQGVGVLMESGHARVRLLYHRFFALAPQILRLFIREAETSALGAAFLRIACLAVPLSTVNFLIIYTLQAMGKGLQSAALTFSRQGLLNIPLLIVMNLIFGLYGMIWTQLVVEVIMLPLSLGMYRKVWRKLTK